MRQDGEARFCDECNKHVYDLTCLSGEEVRAFVSTRGRMCGRVAATVLALSSTTGCSAADQTTAQTTIKIGPLTAPPPKPDAGTNLDDSDQPMMGEIEMSH